MSDKLREDFEKRYEGSIGYLSRNEIDRYVYEETEACWSSYKAATERAARICDRKLTDCTHSYTASVLTRLAKEIRGEV